ncbi:zinc finger BED domain-containing protein 4-like [Episyrphus balteatus]|uniref:zinc finger BED domain-containing protein 4-like n=1 Tax=Episyrphus balteatus TaxID=286459 RepID=UPI0024864887|nr:zinc finger BED domain-containing protein 4-like [Episyrphus balteatus]
MPKDIRKHSTIWDHFTQNEKYKKDKLAKCNYCSFLISISGGSNGNLNRHLKTRHSLLPHLNERNPMPQTSVNPTSSSTSTSTTQVECTAPQSTSIIASQSQPLISSFALRAPPVKKAQEIDQQIVKMIAKGHHALRIVEEPEFRKLIEMISNCPGYKLPYRKKLTTSLIPDEYQKLVSDIKIKLQMAPAVCVTTDCWTSSTNMSYIGVTAHFIDDSTNLCSALIACNSYADSHDAKNLCKLLESILNEWEISNKITAVVSDNAANILAAVRLGGWQSIGCFAHSLNLVVQKSTTKIANTLIKVKAIVEYFKRSAQGLQKLKAVQKQMNMPELKLKQDVPTRWNSTFDMLERIVKIKDAVITVIALNRIDLSLDKEDWMIIEETLPLLKPFYEVQDLHKELKDGMDYRFKDLEKNILYAECTILDPRFKNRGFRNQSAFETACKSLRSKIGSSALPQDLEVDMNEVDCASTRVSSEQEQKTRSIWDDYDSDFVNAKRPPSRLPDAIREFNRYMNEEYLNREINPLK